MTGTPADDPPSVSPLEDEMYTEFLDLAAANSDLSVLQAPEGEGLREGGPAPSVRYVVGGAIFNRQKNKGKTINSAFLSNVRLRRGLGRGAGSVGVLDFGALFCPFTKQFFSLRSPHWSHLRSAGFDINAMLLFGRTVDLVYPRLLYRTACRIQRNVSQALTDGTGKSRYPPMWSPTLQNTLGALLENAPTTTLDQFHEFMTERLEMTRGEEKQRLIPIALDSARCLPGAPPMHEMHDLDKMMSSRTRLLQQVPKIPYAPCAPYNIAPDSSSAVEIGSQRVLDALHHNPAIQLPGLPRHVRSAFVRLPFRKAYTHGSPIFNVCTSFLKEMITTKGDANVYFCPIEHTVDYNSVSDLLAFPVLDTTHFDGTAPTDGTPVPLLAIGFDIVAGEGEDVYFADHTKNIIVFSNAHLLSRRAVGRILDQWTRNGAAAHCVNQSTVSEPVRRTNGGESTNHEKRKHWQLMLNQFPFTFPTRAFYTQPFGSVQAVFVGFDFSHQITEKRAGVGESELIVSQTPAENVFNLSEPLSFTLMRIKDRYHCLSAEAKTAFLEEVIRGARSTFPDLKVEERVTLTLPSGRVSSKLLSCSLSAAKGGSIFYRSCEELLEEGEDFSKTERVLTKFPFLSLLQCQHPLVDAYMLSIPDSDIPSRSPPRMNEDGKVGLYTYHRFADFLNAFEENVKLNERSSRASSKACYDPLKTFNVSTIFRCKYTFCAEPMVLKGCWSNCLLFCAPVLADVTLLKKTFKEYVSACVRNENACVRVLEVDVFHIDYVVFPKDRKCRLFGIRASWNWDGEWRGEADAVSSIMERSVQSALYRCSRDAHFFPLWAYDATYASGTQLSKKATAPSSGIFSMVDEKNTPASPGIVERRLFAMAMKQHRALDLAVGCFVQLLTGVKVLDGTRGGSSLVPRGTVCQVVEFIRIAPDTQLDQAPFHVPAAYHDLVLKYVNDNLDAPSVLPLVKIVNEDTIPQGGTTLSFLLYPTPSLIGGLPSLHHYALPVLHLPVLVLTVAAKYHATSMRRTTIPRRHLTLPFYSSDLYHPYYVDECILNDDVLSADKRVIVMEDLVDNFSSKAGRTPFWLAEDIFYELVESDRSGTENDTNAVHATRLHCQLLTEVSLFIDS